MATTETRLRVVTSEDVQEARKIDAITYAELVSMAVDIETQCEQLLKLTAKLRVAAMRGDRNARRVIVMLRDESYSLHADCLNELGE